MLAIYDMSHITNNDFQPWVVQGYIAQTKNVEVSWAKATKSTAQENLKSEEKSKKKKPKKPIFGGNYVKGWCKRATTRRRGQSSIKETTSSMVTTITLPSNLFLLIS